jgi:hypothetical protein
VTGFDAPPSHVGKGERREVVAVPDVVEPATWVGVGTVLPT